MATEYVSSFIVPTETQIAAVPVIVPGVAGKATTVTVIWTLALSSPVPNFCDTQNDFTIAAVVTTTGVAVKAVPPVAAAYHLNVYPDKAVAVNVTEGDPTHTVKLVTPGDAGVKPSSIAPSQSSSKLLASSGAPG